LPLPFVSTGESSALTPASDESSCVKLRVEVGMATSCSEETCRAVVAVSVASNVVSPDVIVITSPDNSPISSLSSSVRGTLASTSMFCRNSFLKPVNSTVTS
jgi:hypothetical protein